LCRFCCSGTMYLMSDPVKLSTLEAIAQRHGRPSSAVRIAVNRDLIHKAQRRGIRGSRGAGHEWLYPPGTDRALKRVFRLQKLGYRGGALRFQLWWDETAPFSSAIRKYIAGVLISPSKNIEAQLNRTLKHSPLKYETEEEAGVDVGGYTVDQELSPYTLRSRMNRVLSKPVLSYFLEVLKKLDPSATLRPDQLGQVVRVFASTMMGISPMDVQTNARDLLITYLSLELPRGSDAPCTIEELVDAIHSPVWFDTLIDHVQSARPEGYDVARSYIKDDPYLPKVLAGLTWGLRRAAKPRRTMGEWRFPETAVRAVVLGYLVGAAKAIQIKARTDDISSELRLT
ncbi:MAG: hypothetical protein ACC700_19260, partial [Anaerolineales bacterium]